MIIPSPRSANYERLEGGHGPSRSNSISSPNGAGPGGKKRFAWKRFAIGAAVLIGLVWLVGPRETRQKLNDWVGSGGSSTDVDIVRPPNGDNIPHNTHTNSPPPAHTRPNQGSDTTTTPSSSSSPTSPLNFDTDPDKTKTTFCTKPDDPLKPLVQYALMIDAGSTGSRIHIYKFNNCHTRGGNGGGGGPTYEYEVFKMTQPGLSAYATDPTGAAESLDVLLDEALRVVPKSLHACTPVAVKATAGLRLLPGTQSRDILEAVEKRLTAKYPFRIKEHGGVVIMDGKDEGVFAWITANYLLGTIGGGGGSSNEGDGGLDSDASGISSLDSTYAVLDLGGASTQIVFEPTFSQGLGAEGLLEGEHKYELDFGGQRHVLYQHSYLGYGLMKARDHVHKLVEFMDSIRVGSMGHTAGNGNVEGAENLRIVGNPCLAQGTRKTVKIVDERTGETRSILMDGEQIGGFEACDRIIQLVMAKDSICNVKPCSFNGVYQPSLLETFPSGKVLLLSYFYDRLNPILSVTSPGPTKPKITISTLSTLAEQVCLGHASWSKHFSPSSEADAGAQTRYDDLVEELEGRPEWCLDLTFMHGLLRLGYEFEDEREVVIGKRIDGTELGWCLGATLEMIAGELSCRA
ncbi:hypothetical protein AX16_004993 [Volvariella volvacea WC 439]|nr:hypothetical protein AX16_004993 [Volvariella volvacea WC 439]